MAHTPVEQLTLAVDGGTLSVLSAGPQTGERIVLLHGIPANAALFRDVLPLLGAAGYRALAPHMPGYGGTRLADDADYSLAAVADRYARWLETGPLKPVWLVGHDLGGAVAQLMAVRYPHLLTHLTLGNAPIGDSFPVFAVHLAILTAKLGLMGPLVTLGLFPNPYMTHEVRRGFGDPAHLTDEMLQSVFWDSKIRDAQGRQAFARHLKHLRNHESVALVPQLAHISVPTLVLWSERDRHQPAQTTGQRLLSALPAGSAYEVVPDAGHFMPLEAPAAYVEKLLQWRRALDGREGGQP